MDLPAIRSEAGRCALAGFRHGHAGAAIGRPASSKISKAFVGAAARRAATSKISKPG